MDTPVCPPRSSRGPGYQHIFECVPEALLVIDAAERIQEVNARAEWMFEMPARLDADCDSRGRGTDQTRMSFVPVPTRRSRM